MRYLSPQPRYYYFRFLKTNCRYRILLPVSISTYLSSSVCHSASAYSELEIWQFAAELSHFVVFSNGSPQLCTIWSAIMVDYPRCVIFGLSLILIIRLDWIFSSGDIATFRFRHFGLKWGIFLSNDISHCFNLKMTATARKYEPQSVRIGSAVSIWAGRRIEKKEDSLKVTKSL